MSSKEKGQNSRSKQKKKLRETNSYKIQFKTKKNNNKSNPHSKDKDKKINKNNKCTYSNSNISAKTYNQKPTSSIIRDFNNQSQNNNNNAISYSNYAFSEIEQSKKNQNNELYDDSIKNNNEDYNSLHQSKNDNNKMDINDLNNTNNKKKSVKRKTDIKVNNDKDFQNNDFSKRAAYSTMNDNQKKFGNFFYNTSKIGKDNRNIYETSLKRLDDKLNNRLNPNNFKKITIENEEKDYKFENELEQYISNSKINIEENYQNENLLMENYPKNKRQINNKHPENEKQNKINDYLNNINNNPNGQDLKLNYKYNHNLQVENENNTFENNITNTELYNELEEKLHNLYMKIRCNNIDEPPLSEIPKNINNSESYQNQMTYQTLKRYRQKSEPSLRINPFDSDFNNNFNTLNLNSNLLRQKKSETKKSNNNTICNTLIVKYPQNENENKSLSELRMLEKNLKNENSSQRMINVLLNKENKPEIKNILSELQMTIKKLPHNEDCKEDTNISTLPPNHLFPFDLYKLQKNNRNNKFKINNFNIREINNNRKIEKIKSKLNDFQDIINKKPKSKNTLNVEPKDIKEKYLIRHNNRKNYTNLCPANNVGQDLFYLESYN